MLLGKISRIDTGYWESKGSIRVYWGQLGYQDSKLGLPTGPEVYDSATNTWSQTYVNGTIYYRDGRGAWYE